jgi:hypothetical protein
MPVRGIVTRVTLTALLAGVSGHATAQNTTPNDGAAARTGEIAHAQKMLKLFPDFRGSAQETSAVIPTLEIDPDPGGAIGSFQPNGPTITAKNAFFQDLGNNGRSCGTCHGPADGWSLSAQQARERFSVDPDEPLFRLVDGATCPSDDVSTPEKSKRPIAYCWRRG